MRLREQATQRRHGLGSGLSALILSAIVTAMLAAPAFTPPAEAQTRQFYGVAIQAPAQGGHLALGDYVRMRSGGVGKMRFLIPWGNVETQPREYSWAGPDVFIGNAAVRGIRLLPYVSGPPAHLNTPPTEASDRRAFRRFMSALARRYGRGGTYWRGPYQRQHGNDARPLPVRTWQLFNEQNGRFFWGGRPSPRAYGRLVKMGARGIRSHTPQAEIVLGGMFASPRGGGSMASWQFLNRLYRVPGIKRFFDTVAVHPYAPNLRGVRTQMRRIRNVMRRNNHRTGLTRVTELGWGSRPTDHHLNKTPQEQARMLRGAFRLMARKRHRRGWNVRGMTWFSWQDGDGCPFCASSGLFSGPRNDRSPKPAWEAFTHVARQR